MKSWIATLLVTIAVSVPAMAQKPNVNPEWGTAAYAPNTIFTPDRDVGTPFKKRVLVVFHGFRSAVPNGTYKRVRKALRDTHTVIGVNYDYFDVEATIELLDALVAGDLAGHEISTFGTSLGGYWANWFGQRIGAHSIAMINPTLRPGDHLKQYIGQTVESERRALTFPVSKEDIQRYDAVPSEAHKPIPTMVIVSSDDELVDPQPTLDWFEDKPEVEIVIYQERKHTLNLKKHPARDVLKAFFQAQ